MRRKLKLFSHAALAFTMVISLIQFLPATTEKANAASHIGVMYFSGTAGTVSMSNCALILGGYGGGADKQAFINFVLGAYNTPLGGRGCGGGMKVGAAYIIQTMRGVGVGSRALPNAADIQDWENLINQPSVHISTNPNYAYSVDTALKYNSAALFSGVDVGQFYRSSAASSTVFTQDGIGEVYAMRNPCGNPVGQGGGISRVVPTDYALNPSITANLTASEPAGTVVVSPAVTNSGSIASTNTQWQLSEFVIPAGGVIPVAGTSITTPEVYYGNSTTKVDSGIGASFPPGTVVIGNPSELLPDALAGSHVCYALSVQARSDSDTSWAHSNPVCIVIAKKPKFQVLGSDLIVGRTFVDSTVPAGTGNVDTSQSIKTTNGTSSTFGSWSEYGILASGTITGMGSGAAFAFPGLANATVCNYSTLSFDNASSETCGGGLGGYVTTQTMPDIAGRFLKGKELKNLDIHSSTDGGVYIYDGTGNITITGNGKQQSAGRVLVVKAPNATVTITGNITYTTDVLHSIADIPQVIIIAKDIIIDDSAPNIVTNVDAWLVAYNSINTCGAVDAVTTALTTLICADPLVVNGPVMTNKLYLNRTAGSGVGAASADAAETFNLRPDAYLWGYAQTVSGTRLEPVYSTSLPPRF